MKKLFSTLSAVLFLSFVAHSQIVINEVMYNIPGSQAELEEFVELHNTSAAGISLQDYTFTRGITFTFSNVTIPAGGFYVIGLDSVAFNNCFGMFPNAVFTGGLSNSGEALVLRDNNGGLVDSVYYRTTAPWPVISTAVGRSIQLCDPLTDNTVGSNWGITNTASGVVSNGIDSVYASPGVANSCVTFVAPAAPSYPVYTFDQINGLDGNGLADSSGVYCELRGIADCVDLRGGAGYDFPFSNSNNSAGIRLFSNADVNNYTLTAGDSLHIKGKVQQFNGLLQFLPDSIMVISQGNALATPMTVSKMDESTENKLVVLLNMHLVDPAAWTTGVGSGFNVLLTDGSADTTLVRIDNDIDLFNEPAPTGNFSISGWGGQFDTSTPYTDGYQLLPCSMAMLVGTTELENNSQQVLIYPNPVSNALNISSDVEIESILVYNTLGQQVIAINNVHNTTSQVNTSNLENGVYIINIVSNKKMMTKQFQVIK